MITIEMIDEFRRRTNCSYDDARYFLEKHNGDLLEAIIEFEKVRSTGRSTCRDDRKEHVKNGFIRFIQRLFDIKIIITDKTERTVGIPIIFPIMMAPIWHILILISIAMMMLGYRFGFREYKDDNFNVETIVSRVKEKVKVPRNY